MANFANGSDNKQFSPVNIYANDTDIVCMQTMPIKNKKQYK